MSIVYIPIAVILWLIAIIILSYSVIHVLGMIETIRVKCGTKPVTKERYFLYDSQNKHWVETTKDPTGGDHDK